MRAIRIAIASFALVVAAAAVCTSPATAANLPPGFAETRLAAGLANPTAMSVAPDGRVFVSEQAGNLRVIKNDALLAAPAVTLTVDATNERGLLGTAFDPDFASNGFIYVYYTTPSPAPHNRISRFTLAGDLVVAGSEQVLMELPALGLAPIHNAGSMHFGPDGKLYVSVGENFNAPNSQSLNTTMGKLLRINRDGSIPGDNPFFGAISGNNRAIWAWGLRNPYTFAIQRTSGRIFVNDVGDKLFDEINDIVKGGNYGWPETEGPHDDPRFEKPFYAQAWNPRDCTLIGAAFYDPTTRDFPVAFVGKYFFADLCGNYIKVLDTATRAAEVFATGLSTPVDLDVSADGKLYYLNRGGPTTGGGSVFRIFHSHAAPTISIHPDSQLISVGEPVTFSCAGNGAAPLSIRWESNGAPIPGATGGQITFLVSAADNGARFRCVISNEHGSVASNEALLTVTSDRTPTATILAPVDGATYTAGTTLFFAGEAQDPEEGALPAEAFTWEVVFDHGDHTHPGVVLSGVKSGSYQIANIGEPSANVKYRVILRVRDRAGLTRVVQRDVRPRLTRITLTTNPPGRVIKLDGQPRTLATPLTFDGVVGLVRTVDAPTFQQEREASPVWYELQSWSDGGAASHPITLPAAPTTYTANFKRVEFPACITFDTLSRFINMPLPPQTETFTVDLDVTPTAFPVSANIGFSDRPRGGLPGQAALVAFGTNGKVTVRDVGGGRADVPFDYQANITYHLRLLVDLAAHRYDVFIAPPGGPEVQLANDYGFRVEHALITRIDNWGGFASPNPSGGTLEVCHVETNCSEGKNTPPVVKAPPDLVVRTGAAATSCSRLVLDAELGRAQATDNCGRVAVTRTGVPAGNLFPVGTTLITHTATDAGGATATAVQKVTVIDDTPPVITNLTVGPAVLWPPDGKLRDVTLGYDAADACGGAVRTTLSVASNDDCRKQDWVVVDPHHVQLRARHGRQGQPRVYTITVNAADPRGNSAAQSTAVQVPLRAP